MEDELIEQLSKYEFAIPWFLLYTSKEIIHPNIKNCKKQRVIDFYIITLIV